VSESVDGEKKGDGSQSWEPFAWDRGLGSLAAYVSPQALMNLKLNPDISDLEKYRGTPDFHHKIAARLFNSLHSKGITYAIEPWLGAVGRQQIRHPQWLLEDRWGTCVDLCVTFAAMCLQAGLRPLLAITGSHAFVVVTPEGVVSGIPVMEWKRDWIRREDNELSGVYVVEDPDEFKAEIKNGLLLAIDCVSATVPGGGFNAAREAAKSSIVKGCLLVDVASLHARYTPKDRPSARPSIRTYVPGGQDEFVGHDGHREIFNAISQENGIVVLVGPAGQGKSTIARKIALDETLGQAWFLNASERQSLITSLADADLAEDNARAIDLDDKDREGFYLRALSRLSEANGRWIVVLDNADGDPTKMLDLVPTPGPNQLVIVTTTNREWEGVSGVRVRQLPAIDDVTVTSELGGNQLVGFVAGRALMLHSFQKLLAGGEISVDEIRMIGDDITGVTEQLRGPMTFWKAVRESIAATSDDLQICLTMAYLPPDQQPLELLSELCGDSLGIVTRLAGAGLVALEIETRSLRLHRLFGEAIRRDVGSQFPEMDAATVRRIVASDFACKVIDRYGGFDTVKRLEDRLIEIDQLVDSPDEELGISLHAIARLLELQGHTRESGSIFDRSERHIVDRPELIADSLHGRARTVNQHHAGDEVQLRAALDWAVQAERLFELTPGHETSSDRCVAMQGLLQQKLANFPREGESKRELLLEALAMVERANASRAARLHSNSPELARSEFNLAGPRIGLAQADPGHASAYLDGAEKVYKTVLQVRREVIYKREVHPHIAACIIGLAYVDYYRALLLPSLPAQRSAWLRNSTNYALEALRQREILDGSVDLEESKKVTRFLAKVAVVRFVSQRFPESNIVNLKGEIEKEMIFSASPMLPSKGKDARDAIRDWIYSPALRAIVETFGETVPTSSEPLNDADITSVLEWLDEFSLRWDSRGGRERNLVDAFELPEATRGVVEKSSPALGLVGTNSPPSNHYDYVLILGGLVRACFARPLYASRLINEGTITVDKVCALGAYRRLQGDELQLAQFVGHPGLRDEFDAMDAGVREAFDLGDPVEETGLRSEVVGESWRISEYGMKGDLTVAVVGAPSTEPGVRRANTPDTYKWFASTVAQLRGGERILIVTSDIYRPFQHADALRMLSIPFSVDVDVVGIQPGDVHPGLGQQFQTHNYLQELRSTILAYRALNEAIDIPQ